MWNESFVDCGGVRLHVLDWGGAGRAIVLLGGLGATAHLFQSLAPKLSRSFRVVALKRRGQGRSDRPEAGYELDTLVADIATFMDALALERATLVGHSFAGLEMTRFAILHPERVEGIVYLDALDVVAEPPPDGNPALEALELAPSADDLASPAAYLAFQRRRPDVGSIWCDAVEADRLEDMTIDGVRDPHAARARQRSIGLKLFEGLGADRSPDYAAAKVPMLAIVPVGRTNPFLAEDAPEPLRRAANRYWVERYLPWAEARVERFRSAVPSARVVGLETSNHSVFIAREDETLRALLDFLRPSR